MVALLKNPMKISSEDWSDRRIFPRKEVNGEARGRRLDHTIEARQDPRVSLSLRDLSLGGLSALIDKPIKSGERLNIFFPRTGMGQAWDAVGRVIRCSPTTGGYRIAMEFDPIPMAA
jgi:hypothetical protein